jgi:hypothetical protein
MSTLPVLSTAAPWRRSWNRIGGSGPPLMADWKTAAEAVASAVPSLIYEPPSFRPEGAGHAAIDGRHRLSSLVR